MNLAIVFLISCHVTVAADSTRPRSRSPRSGWRTSGSRKRNWTISKILVQLGDPRKPQKGESLATTSSALPDLSDRVHGLILLQMEYEEALSTRYELQADLDFYLWEISSEDKGFAAQQKQKRRDGSRQSRRATRERMLAVQAALSGSRQRATVLNEKAEPYLAGNAGPGKLNEDVRSCEPVIARARRSMMRSNFNRSTRSPRSRIARAAPRCRCPRRFCEVRTSIPGV